MRSAAMDRSSRSATSQAKTLRLQTSITRSRYSQIPRVLVGRSVTFQLQTSFGPALWSRGTGRGSFGGRARPPAGKPGRGRAAPGKSWVPNRYNARQARTDTIWPGGSATNSRSLQVSRFRWRSSSLRRSAVLPPPIGPSPAVEGDPMNAQLG